MEKRQPDTVTTLTRRIKSTLESTFSEVWVEGEISNFKLMSSGHAYFVLKDATAQIACAFFGLGRRRLEFEVRDGVKVRLFGEISLYEQRGSYQIIVRSMEPTGLGDLMAQFEALKRRLNNEGLFDPAHKKPLPMLPRRIGIVTSPTGAAIRDMLNVTRRRFAGLHILIAPARVQGTEAIAEIVAGIELLNALPEPPDVMIVGRGGGSIEDLWCFNEEAVARAIFASKIPIISAVGHEIDFTISDFVADLRAPTPSAAAELVVGRKADFEATCEVLETRLNQALYRHLERAHARLDVVAGSHVFRQPEYLLRQHTQHLDLLSQQLTALLTSQTLQARQGIESMIPRQRVAIQSALHDARQRLSLVIHALQHAFMTQQTRHQHRLNTLATRLESVNPLAVLSRGYGLVRCASGRVITRACDVAPGEAITTRLQEGEITSIVVGDSDTKRTLKKTASKKGRTSKPASSYEQSTLF